MPIAPWGSIVNVWADDTITWSGVLVNPVNDIPEGVGDPAAVIGDTTGLLQFLPGDAHDFSVVPMRFVTFDVEDYRVVDGLPVANDGLVVEAGPVCSVTSLADLARPNPLTTPTGAGHRWLPVPADMYNASPGVGVWESDSSASMAFTSRNAGADVPFPSPGVTQDFLYLRGADYDTGPVVRTAKRRSTSAVQQVRFGMVSSPVQSDNEGVTFLMVVSVYPPPEGKVCGLIDIVNAAGDPLCGVSCTSAGEIVVTAAAGLSRHLINIGGARPTQPVVIGVRTTEFNPVFHVFSLDRRLISVRHASADLVTTEPFRIRVGMPPAAFIGSGYTSLAQLDVFEMNLWESYLSDEEMATKINLLDAMYGVSQG